MVLHTRGTPQNKWKDAKWGWLVYTTAAEPYARTEEFRRKVIDNIGWGSDPDEEPLRQGLLMTWQDEDNAYGDKSLLKFEPEDDEASRLAKVKEHFRSLLDQVEAPDFLDWENTPFDGSRRITRPFCMVVDDRTVRELLNEGGDFGVGKGKGKPTIRWLSRDTVEELQKDEDEVSCEGYDWRAEWRTLLDDSRSFYIEHHGEEAWKVEMWQIGQASGDGNWNPQIYHGSSDDPVFANVD